MRKSILLAILALIPVSFAHAQIPAIERAALIALYNSADGGNWTNDTNWLGPAGTECTWYGVSCWLEHVDNLHLGVGLNGTIPTELGNLSEIRWLTLSSEQLRGPIPTELENLSNLLSLDLSGCQLSGSIPTELANLSSLRYLYLGGNELNGSIPPELGSMSTLWYLSLHTNHLSGSIPPELGNLPELTNLLLNSNQLGGEIPSSLENLTTLFPLSLDISWNALHTDDASLSAFLTSKHSYFGDWQSTQTISPVNVTVDSVGDHTVWLGWDAVNPQVAPGGYHLFILRPGSGAWESVGWTESKWTTAFPVTGLDPGMSYDIAVTTYTDPHLYNAYNRVGSDIGSSENLTTSSFACAQPVIRMSGAGPFTLSLIGTYDGYLWSTGETTPTIEVNPPPDEWFWVTVTSAGGCEESAATLVDPNIFADGFESGNTTAWSGIVP